MYKGYKIVVNTAAGRRRYMQYLIPFIVSCPIVDRYDIWVNTHNGADIEFFKRVAALYPVGESGVAARRCGKRQQEYQRILQRVCRVKDHLFQTR